MNANFSDISATVSNLVQNGFSRTDTGVPARSGGNGFEDQYQRELRRFDTPVDSGTDPRSPIRERGRAQQVASTVSKTVENMGDTEGEAFVSKLEQVLRQISGGNLKAVSMEASGLDALEKLLLKAGFNAGEVKGLISGLKEKAENQTLSLDDVLGAVRDLQVEVDDKAGTETVYLETSALPFIKQMLNELGLTEEDISGVLDGADQKNGDIDLDTIIEKLKHLEETYRQSGQMISVADADDSFKTLMGRLNLSMENKTGDTVTLNDLIRAFEDLKLQNQNGVALEKNGAAVRSEPVDSILNQLFQSLSLASQAETASTFSYQMIKGQLANDMGLSPKNLADEKGVFSQQVMPDAQTDALVKELVSLLSKSGSNGSASSEREHRASSFGKELNPDLSKTNALFQGNAGPVTDADSGNTPKASATPRPLPSYVNYQVERSIVRAVNQGESSLKLQLKPAELGRLTLTIDHQSTGIKVTIVTENHSARDMLASNVNELKAALSSAGISLESFDVDMNSDFRQSMANAGNQSGQSGRKNGGRQGRDNGTLDGDISEEMSAVSGGPVLDGSYHFVA